VLLRGGREGSFVKVNYAATRRVDAHETLQAVPETSNLSFPPAREYAADIGHLSSRKIRGVSRVG